MEKRLEQLIKKNREIFWDVPSGSLNQLSQEAIFERILEFGNIESFEELTEATKGNTAQIFNRLINKKRVNLSPRIINFMNTYLEYNS
ncbi:hypothetical protein JW978_00380 [Candidatus Dojkabacteria bacterium]|nr:hypothetical protein [Candidatus Dojkabacteria bacterium]